MSKTAKIQKIKSILGIDRPFKYNELIYLCHEFIKNSPEGESGETVILMKQLLNDLKNDE